MGVLNMALYGPSPTPDWAAALLFGSLGISVNGDGTYNPAFFGSNVFIPPLDPTVPGNY